jgi:hypothetical protein
LDLLKVLPHLPDKGSQLDGTEKHALDRPTKGSLAQLRLFSKVEDAFERGNQGFLRSVQLSNLVADCPGTLLDESSQERMTPVFGVGV